MTLDAINIIKTLFNSALSLLSSFIIPGTVGVTPLTLILFVVFITVSIKFVKHALKSEK